MLMIEEHLSPRDSLEALRHLIHCEACCELLLETARTLPDAPPGRRPSA